MIRVRQIKVDVRKDSKDDIVRELCKKLGINKEIVKDIKIIRKSLDARFKPNLYYVYELDVLVDNEDIIIKKNSLNKDIFMSSMEEYQMPLMGECNLNNRPVVVGAGPAGLFCAYLLAEMGYRPLVIERGEKIEDRVITVDKFWKDNKLNKESNVQFGEGGAGTFSDGKLNTLTKDKNNRFRKVFETFVMCGSDEDIMYSGTPHIGTDVLRDVIINMRNKIISMGGEFLYNSCLTDINIESNKVKSIVINNNLVIDTDVLVLAIGHSARDTFSMLYDRKINMTSKPFAIGIRIQHPQEVINKNQYGKNYYEKLPPANYKLTYKASDGRGVYSFCMCPGGYVVNASSEEGRLAINGMSYHDRSSNNANSAIVVTVTNDDFGDHPLNGIKYQRELEEKAFNLGKGLIPIQMLGDYYNDVESTKLGMVKPIFKGGYAYSNLNKLYPEYINISLKEAIVNFGKKIDGFDNSDSIIAGIESRTSSPVKIIRDENYESNIKGIYPCGEGAGYAGGITTSSVDGIKVAEAIINKYKKIG